MGAKVSHSKWILLQTLKKCTDEEVEAFNQAYKSIEEMHPNFVWAEIDLHNSYIKAREAKFLKLLMGSKT